MDINNLKAFIEVADKRSFSRTAESLSITQPAVSKRIAALESELSVKLFDRIGRTVHLTEAGRVLLPAARQISSELSRIEDVICNLGNDVSGKLSIGTTEYIGTHRLPEILRTFRENYPAVDFELHFSNSEDSLVAIDSGLIEIALCSVPGKISPQYYPKLREAEIWSDELVIACAKNHSLNTGAPLTIHQLSSYPAILPPPRSSTRKNIDEVMRKHNLRVQVATEANDIETIKSLASIGLGWAALPKFQVDKSLAVLAVADLQIKHTMSLVRHRERTLSRAAQAFINALPTQLASADKPQLVV